MAHLADEQLTNLLGLLALGHVLQGVREVDLSTTVLGQKLALPIYCSPTALQRLFHHDGERAVAKRAARHACAQGAVAWGQGGGG